MTTTSSHPIYNSALNNNTLTANATMRRQPNPSIIAQGKLPLPQQQQQSHQPDIVEAIPNSNSIDSAMYERDKQIYRCSTLRQGGKFDSKYKPSILNCPLPEIPKEASESPKKDLVKEQNSVYSKTLQRPPMKLPPTAKAIPPPKIDTPTSPPQNITMQSNNTRTLSKSGIVMPQQKTTSPPPPPLIQSPKTPNNNSTILTTTLADTTINPNDESNYAVTEL